MIDWERVEELREEVGEDEFEEVVQLFLEEVEDVVQRLRTTPDPASFEEDLHFLKGSALNLGFADFGRLCQEGESRAASGQAKSVDLAPVIDCFARSREAFLSELSARGAA